MPMPTDKKLIEQFRVAQIALEFHRTLAENGDPDEVIESAEIADKEADLRDTAHVRHIVGDALNDRDAVLSAAEQVERLAAALRKAGLSSDDIEAIRFGR